MYHYGVIGLGTRIAHIVNLTQKQSLNNFKLAAVADLKPKEAFGHIWPESIQDAVNEAVFYTDAQEMLEKEHLDGVFIGTRCSTHARLARLVMDKGIPLFLEKPVCTNMEDWIMLRRGYEQSNGRTVVSFPLRVSGIVRRVKEIVDSGKLGRIEHVQALNYVPYGGTYFNNWYRNEEETGGLFLQKATHDFDYINYILGTSPVSVAAMGSKQIFKGNEPAGLKCVDCQKYLECPESPLVRKGEHDPNSNRMCCFATDTGNHDSASALVRYETGMHVGYTQNFFARKKAQKRGAIFSGYEGTLEFDFYKSEIRIFQHLMDVEETIRFEEGGGHFGGDESLVNEFINLISKGEPPTATLRDGLVSALMCLQARESEQRGTFCKIEFDAY